MVSFVDLRHPVTTLVTAYKTDLQAFYLTGTLYTSLMIIAWPVRLIILISKNQRNHTGALLVQLDLKTLSSFCLDINFATCY